MVDAVYSITDGHKSYCWRGILPADSGSELHAQLTHMTLENYLAYLFLAVLLSSVFAFYLYILGHLRWHDLSIIRYIRHQAELDRTRKELSRKSALEKLGRHG